MCQPGRAECGPGRARAEFLELGRPGSCSHNVVLQNFLIFVHLFNKLIKNAQKIVKIFYNLL